MRRNRCSCTIVIRKYVFSSSEMSFGTDSQGLVGVG